MAVDPPTETFTLEAKWHFKTEEERVEFRNHIMSGACFDQNMQPITMKFDSFFSHCKECGCPKWMGKLGHGTSPLNPKDACKSAYGTSCTRIKLQGGYKPNA